ncbi:MAG: BglG family transcription antiterminator [Clostridiales bacterium]|nr:BglG family transcription antiterminator [Clostridiales bacterium]
MSGSTSTGPGPRRLTSRQVSIIQMLPKTGSKPVTIRAIAEKLGVSSRTILREMPAIEAWFEENDFSFVRKPGVGLMIQEEPETIQLLQELLHTEQVKTTYSRRERRRQLLGELLCAKEPVKSYVFLSRFHISEGTLSNDLDALNEWLSDYGIKVIRRPGVGILLEGSESAYRQAIANAAFEFMDEGEILQLLRGQKEEPAPPSSSTLLQDRLFSFIDPQIVTFVERVLAESEKQLDIKFTDSGYMALVVHLSLAIRRLQSGETIEMDADELAELAALPEHDAAVQIAGKISSQFRLDIPEEEVGFITMHLSSARIWPQSRKPRSQVQSINTRQVVMALVDSVEAEIGLPFHTCTRMIEELMSHMDSMISRLSMNLHLDNAQVEDIQQNYPDIYAAVERACGIFKDLLQINDISPSEITFVAMHFVAAAETLRVEQKRVAVAVVCPSGMGASRMLAANLMRSFHNIEIRQIVSAFSLEPKALREAGIDLVISTVPLQLDFPNICVSPIPQAQDMLVITNAVEAINKDRKANAEAQKALPQAAKAVTLADIRSLTRTGEEIAQLLDHFTIREVPGLQRAEELLGEAAGLFATTVLERQRIGSDLARREQVKSTYLPHMSIYLLHCRTAAVSHCRFGYLRLDHTILTHSGTVMGAVLLLAPKTDWPEEVEVISRLSMLLVEDKRFLQALQAGDQTRGKALAEQALVKYYATELKRIGDGKL